MEGFCVGGQLIGGGVLNCCPTGLVELTCPGLMGEMPM